MKYLKRFYLPLLSITGLIILIIFSNELPFSGLLRKEQPNLSKLGYLPLVIPTIKYGFAIDTFSMAENTIKNGEVIGNILNENGVEAQIIHNIMNDNQHIFKPSNFRVGERYT
ncbi:MAG: hypothetical protein ACK49K_17535, partial [Bacteroidota bacterium]